MGNNMQEKSPAVVLALCSQLNYFLEFKFVLRVHTTGFDSRLALRRTEGMKEWKIEGMREWRIEEMKEWWKTRWSGAKNALIILWILETAAERRFDCIHQFQYSRGRAFQNRAWTSPRKSRRDSWKPLERRADRCGTPRRSCSFDRWRRGSPRWCSAARCRPPGADARQFRRLRTAHM